MTFLFSFIPLPSENRYKLTIIDNPQANSNLYWDKQGQVLVVTFTKYPEFDLAYSDGTWVTVAPKL